MQIKKIKIVKNLELDIYFFLCVLHLSPTSFNLKIVRKFQNYSR
jgi:hypothetical protein